MSCAIESGSANAHHGGYGPRLLVSNQNSLWWDFNAQTDLKSLLLSWSKLKKRLEMTAVVIMSYIVFFIELFISVGRRDGQI